MHGYAERFDFTGQKISGWVSGATNVVATMDGIVIGAAIPGGTRKDLTAGEPGARLFKINCNKPYTPLDIVSGRLSIKAQENNEEVPLRLTGNGSRALKNAAARALVGDASPNLWSQAELDAVGQRVKSGELSTLLVPPGLESADKSAVIGLRGHLFLMGGSNALLSQYQAKVDDQLTAKVDQWGRLFEQRKEHCEARGIQYLQTTFPEKMTVLRDAAPVPIHGPTPLYQELENRHYNEDFYVSGLEPFEQWGEEDDPYLTTDTHMSAVGAQKVFARLAAKMDTTLVPLVEGVRLDQVRYAAGDLTKRFKLPLYSRIVEPSDDQLSEYREGIVMVDKYLPVGRSTGRRFGWKNSTAPSPKKVLVFGASSFNIGQTANMLSWWGKHFFREFNFQWGPEIDWNLVDRLQPDIVLGQTVERFLGRIPKF